MNVLEIWQDSIDGGSDRRTESTYTGQHNGGKSGQKSMPRVEAKPIIPVFERSRTECDNLYVGLSTKLFSTADTKRCTEHVYPDRAVFYEPSDKKFHNLFQSNQQLCVMKERRHSLLLRV
jgi:hypothetical protein